jgi:hypothetical protein
MNPVGRLKEKTGLFPANRVKNASTPKIHKPSTPALVTKAESISTSPTRLEETKSSSVSPSSPHQKRTIRTSEKILAMQNSLSLSANVGGLISGNSKQIAEPQRFSTIPEQITSSTQSNDKSGLPGITTWAPNSTDKTVPNIVSKDSPLSKTPSPSIKTPIKGNSDIPREITQLEASPENELPEPWGVAYTEDGRAYFYNQITDEVTWERPAPSDPKLSNVKAVDATSSVDSQGAIQEDLESKSGSLTASKLISKSDDIVRREPVTKVLTTRFILLHTINVFLCKG